MVKRYGTTLGEETTIKRALRVRLPREPQSRQLAVIDHRQAREQVELLEKVLTYLPGEFDYEHLGELEHLVSVLSVSATRDEVNCIIDEAKRSGRWPGYEVIEDRASAIAALKRRVLHTGASPQLIAEALARCEKGWVPLDLAKECNELLKMLKRAERFIADVKELHQEKLQQQTRATLAEQEDKEWQQRLLKWVGPTRLNDFLLAEKTMRRLLFNWEVDIRQAFEAVSNPTVDEEDWQVRYRQRQEWVCPLIRYFVAVSGAETPPRNGGVTKFLRTYHDIRNCRTKQEAERIVDEVLDTHNKC